MSDHETHPIGTGKRLAELEAAISKAATALDNAADDLANSGDFEGADWRRTQADGFQALTRNNGE